MEVVEASSECLEVQEANSVYQVVHEADLEV